jgi:hypothetical protein
MGGGFGSPQLQISGVFATGNRTRDAKDFYTPGHESPAISTADYYHMHACQFLCPYDLSAMGTPGATVMAANGNNRYVWFTSSEHPAGGGGIHSDACGFKLGFSSDPGVLPSVMVDVIPRNNQWTGDATTPGANGFTVTSDMAPSALVYNPDDGSFPFYLYTQGLPFSGNLGTQSIVWKSTNMFDWVGCAWGPKSIDIGATPAAPLTSFQSVFRHGTGNWSTYGGIGQIGYLGPSQWFSTDGKTWTVPATIVNITGEPTVNLTIDAGSGTPNRLTAASSLFSPSDDGKDAALISPDLSQSEFPPPFYITYVSATQVDIKGRYGGNNGLTFTNAAAPFEFAAVANRKAPTSDGSGAIGVWGPGAPGNPFTVGNGSQMYQVSRLDARQNAVNPTEDGMWVSLAAIDASFNVSQTVPAIQVSTQFNGFYPGYGYVTSVCDYLEDGIEHVYAQMGYPGPFGTAGTPYVGATVTGGVSGTTFTVDSCAGYIPLGGYVAGSSNVGQITGQISGTPNGAGVYTVENPGSITIAAHTPNIFVNSGQYNVSSVGGGCFHEQFIDYYTVAYDSTAASDAAPFGVSVSCTNTLVTVSWMSTPLGTGAKTQSYNVYRGSTSGSQTTLVGGTSSLSIVDAPSPGQQWWYKVVKVSGGVETKSRAVHTYVG